jgi:pilus assembly protein CpaE
LDRHGGALMAEPLKVLVVDLHPDAVASLRRALDTSHSLEVVGDAGFGPVASTWAQRLQPDVILVSVDEPLTRSLSTIQALARGAPRWTVVGLVNQFDREVFRRTVLAGARDVLPRTTSAADLRDALVEARRADTARATPASVEAAPITGSIVTVFGVKGGVGKTTIATNLAVALARETSASVALVDLDLPFGDIALMLDLHPEQDILDAVSDGIAEDPERLQKLLVPSPHGVHVLAGPMVPDDAGVVDSSRIAALLSTLATVYQFVIVDTPVGITELTAAALDASELALLVTTPEVPALRRTHACLRLLQGLEFPTGKLHVVLNRLRSRTRISEAEAMEALAQPVAWRVTNDYAAMRAAAYGEPVVLAQPKSRLSRDIQAIARTLSGAPVVSHETWRPWRRRHQALAAI